VNLWKNPSGRSILDARSCVDHRPRTHSAPRACPPGHGVPSSSRELGATCRTSIFEKEQVGSRRCASRSGQQDAAGACSTSSSECGRCRDVNCPPGDAGKELHPRRVIAAAGGVGFSEPMNSRAQLGEIYSDRLLLPVQTYVARPCDEPCPVGHRVPSVLILRRPDRLAPTATRPNISARMYNQLELLSTSGGLGYDHAPSLRDLRARALLEFETENTT